MDTMNRIERIYLGKFRATAFHLFGAFDFEPDVTEFLLLQAVATPVSFSGVSFYQIPVIEALVKQNFFIYDFDIEDGEIIGELIRRSV